MRLVPGQWVWVDDASSIEPMTTTITIGGRPFRLWHAYGNGPSKYRRPRQRDAKGRYVCKGVDALMWNLPPPMTGSMPVMARWYAGDYGLPPATMAERRALGRVLRGKRLKVCQ